LLEGLASDAIAARSAWVRSIVGTAAVGFAVNEPLAPVIVLFGGLLRPELIEATDDH
jgi:hypothetical protein